MRARGRVYEEEAVVWRGPVHRCFMTLKLTCSVPQKVPLTSSCFPVAFTLRQRLSVAQSASESTMEIWLLMRKTWVCLIKQASIRRRAEMYKCELKSLSQIDAWWLRLTLLCARTKDHSLMTCACALMWMSNIAAGGLVLVKRKDPSPPITFPSLL